MNKEEKNILNEEKDTNELKKESKKVEKSKTKKDEKNKTVKKKNVKKISKAEKQKRVILIVVAAVVAVSMIASIFVGINFGGNDLSGTTTVESDGEAAAPGQNSNSSAPSPVSPEAEQPTKYGDAEIYENAEGNRAAKTESGAEVELTQESLNELFSKYEEVKGTGSEEERQILDQIQLLLEANQAQAE